MSQIQSEPEHRAGSGTSLENLAKMSGTGSSYGQSDYVAISPLAIASLLLGLLTLLALVAPTFLVTFIIVAAVGAILGLLAMRKIIQSNGTQSGLWLAIAGMIVSVLVGGGLVARSAMKAGRERQDTQKCAEAVARFGEAIKARKYGEAYDKLTTSEFQEKFTRAFFISRMKEIQMYEGSLNAYRMGEDPVAFHPIGDTHFVRAQTYVNAESTRSGGPATTKEPMYLSNAEGEWKIDDLPRLFQQKQEAGRQKAASHDAEDAASVAAVIVRFGEYIKAGNYEHAYNKLTTKTFRDHITQKQLRDRLQEIQADKSFGPLESLRGNDDRIGFQRIPDSEARSARTDAIAKFAKQPSEVPVTFILNNTEGEWKIVNIGLFQTQANHP